MQPNMYVFLPAISWHNGDFAIGLSLLRVRPCLLSSLVMPYSEYTQSPEVSGSATGD